MNSRKHTRLAAFAAALVAAAALATFIAAGGCHRVPDQRGFTDLGSQPKQAVVQVRCAKIPWVSPVAAHCWFAEYDPAAEAWNRWEVWQTADPGPGGWGHLRKNQSGPGAGVGAGPSWALAEWTGQPAERIGRALADSEAYPYRNTYRYWPGPNSNTFVAWVLRRADVEFDLPPAAWGSGY